IRPDPSRLILVGPAFRLPFPEARLRVVAGDTMLNHFAPAVACDDEAGQITTAEAKGAESRHDNELQQQLAHRSSGSLAMFAAIRRTQISAKKKGPPFSSPKLLEVLHRT